MVNPQHYPMISRCGTLKVDKIILSAPQPKVSGLIAEITVSEVALNFAGMFTVRGRPVQVPS